MPANQLNVEFWYRLLYDCLRGTCYGSPGLTGLSAWLAHLWIWIVIIGYALAVIGLFIIVYCTIRIFELRAREEKYYSTVILAPDAIGGTNLRWQHIESLINGATTSEWRDAIIEADIMLDDLLTKNGYVGDGVGEKLKSVEPTEFKTLQEAWEAHKVRNQIAHQGSAFDLSETLARRTIAHYENVFRELKAI
ncbi:MAG: hypothetical protein WCS97_00465 [Candidatus Paceibacterota bacterium]|jgi:hypothetical protein